MCTLNAATGVWLPTAPANGTTFYLDRDRSAGKFAYVANYNSRSISMYTIDAVTGTLTLIGTIGA